MNRLTGPGIRLATAMATALVLASLGAHLLVAVLDIPTKTATSRKRFGATNASMLGVISGSSLTYDGVDWNQVADALKLTIESWPVPGSSPAEWEQLHGRSDKAAATFIGVSLYDLNEAWLCDFRADLVPLRQTLSDLWESGSEVPFAERVASYYPRTWVRALLPTAGRADRVIFVLRDKARMLLGPGTDDPQGGVALRLASDYTSEERISDWPQDRLLRRLTSMRSVQGKPTFSGPKRLALRRLLERAHRQGTVVVIVLPVSPPYIAELLSSHDIHEFEASLEDAHIHSPTATWVRLDRDPALNSTNYFYDLVHLNMQGRRIATDRLLKRLAQEQGAE